MSEIQFSDGMKFKLDGPYRVVSKLDGLYVVGNGILCPVDSQEEGERFIKLLNGEKGDGPC